jgi:hypothetical protein
VTEVVGVFASKGDALQAVDEMYELGYGDTEIGFLDHQSSREEAGTAGVAAAIFGSTGTDEIGSLYRESMSSGSAVLTVSVVDGDEEDVSRVLYASGALRVSAFDDEVGWIERPLGG